jgi:soluble lytic murein transglycosylase-like protein
MIARLFFILATLFSLTEIIVMVSYKASSTYSYNAAKYISKWVDNIYDGGKWHFGFSKVQSNDYVIKKRVMSLSEDINLFGIEKKYDLPKGLLHAVMHQESAGNINAISSAGAVGPFQFMYLTAKDFGLITKAGADNRKDPEKSAIAAAKYYTKLIDYFNGDINKAIAAYNAGEGRVEKSQGNIYKLPLETRNYVRRVTSVIKMYNNTNNTNNIANEQDNKEDYKL